MKPDDVQVTNVFHLEEMQALLRVFHQVWNFPPGGLFSPEFMVAVTHAGGYAAAAVDPDGHWIGGSFGFLGRHRGQLCLHSHVTGVVPGREHAGVGRVIKHHQRQWALQHDLHLVTWTFDPLVRRNAWFNLQVLGVRIDEYIVNFYGPLHDEINGDDETDRLVAVWDLDPPGHAPGAPRPGPRAARHSSEVDRRHRVVPTPADIVALRRESPIEAKAWRHRLRDELDGPLALGWTITELTTDGAYVLAPPDPEHP